MRYILIKQDDLRDCGICCLLMIIKTYGGNSSKEYLRWITNTNLNGVTALDLINGAKKFNFESYGFKSNLLNISKESLPLIAHVEINKQYKHFIVIYDIDFKNKKILIADPAKKIEKITFSEFEKISTNYYIYLKPIKKILNMKSTYSLLNIYFKFIKNNIGKIIKIFFFLILFSVLTCLSSIYLKIIIDNYDIINFEHNIFLILIITIFFINLIKNMLNYFRYILLIKLNNALDLNVFQNIYSKIITLPYIYFKNRTTGEILTRITDLNNLKDLLTNFIISLFIDLLLIFIAIIFLLLVDYKFILVIIPILLFFVILFLLFKNKYKITLDELKDESEQVNSYIVETVTNIESIRNLNIDDIFINKFTNIYQKYINEFNTFNKILLKNNFLYDLLQNIFFILLIIVSFGLIKSGQLEVTDLIIISSLGTIITNSIINIIDFLYKILDSVASFNRIKELCDIDFNTNNGNECSIKINCIEFNNLNYKYNYKNNVLKNVNFTINENDKLLIVGNSGIGKSTIAKILSGYLDVDDTQVYINKKDINNYNKDFLKQRITFVGQHENLFATSIKENICMGRIIDDTLFIKVCKLMNIEEILVENNLTYDCIIEESGFNISGGQKQRIILARSILKESDVYIFDESLCNLDVSLERKILINLFDYFKDKIIIVISHRFNNQDLFNKKVYL